MKSRVMLMINSKIFFKKNIIIFFILFLFVSSSKVYSQLDTALVLSRYTTLALTNQKLKSLSDDLLGVHHVNPIYRINENFYQQLSTDGSAHQSLVFRIPSLNNIQYQPNIFDANRFTRENIKFYNVYRPYSELRYSTTLNSSRYFSVIHAQNVYKNLQLGLQYDVNYSDGSYDKSSTKNQFFNATARYKDSLGWYEGNLGFIRNRAMQNESGGLISDSSFFKQEYSSLTGYPVNLSSAYTKWKSVDVVLSQKVNIGKIFSSNNPLSKFALVHNAAYYSNVRIYHDANPKGGFYDTCYFSKDLTHDSLSTKHLQNILSLTNQKSKDSTKFYIPFTIGLKHDLLEFRDTLKREYSSLISPYAIIGFDIYDLELRARAEYVLSESRYKNDFHLSVNANYNDLFVGMELMNKSVDYFFKRYSSNNFQWNNEFDKTNIYNINVGYRYKNYFTIKADYYRLNNLVWISGELKPVQSKTVTHLYQASFLHHIKIGLFRFDGIMMLQKTFDDNSLRLPLFQTKQSVAINFKMFGKKLDTQIGLDFRYNTAYYADAYMPAMGAFYRQNEMKVGNYLYTDLFVQLKLERAKLYVALTHPYAGLFGYNYFSTPHYPVENLGLRFGLAWMFFD